MCFSSSFEGPQHAKMRASTLLLIAALLLARPSVGAGNPLEEEDDDDELESWEELEEDDEPEPVFGEDSPVVALTTETFKEVQTSERLYFVEFYVQECEPCRQLTPVLEEAATELAEYGVVVASVDLQANPALAKELAVQTVPAFKVFKGEPKRNPYVDGESDVGARRGSPVCCVRCAVCVSWRDQTSSVGVGR